MKPLPTHLALPTALALLLHPLALLSALTLLLHPLAPPPSPPAFGAASVLIGLRPGVPARAPGGPPLGLAARAGVLAADPLLGGEGGAVYRLRLAHGTTVPVALAALRDDPAVAFAEPDYIAVATGAPNDPGYRQQWGLATIGAETAWATTTGTPETIVAIVDSGIDLDHPDLAGRLWTNPGEIAGNGLDDDNNGFVDDLHGWNFTGPGADLGDVNGHGTQVAGVIGARAGNGLGVAGLCGGCSLMVLKVLSANGTANYSDIAAAIGYAADKGADVINLSLGGASDSAALRAAVAAASGAVLVAGAGNDGKGAPFYPAAYDEHVLAVAAIAENSTKVATSNYGPWVDVTAPGESIYTTYDGGDYGLSSGTSLGAPFASGLAGLLRSAYPAWSAADVRAQIIRTATSVDGANPGFAGQLGSGHISAAGAFSTLAAPLMRVATLSVDGQPSGRPEPGTSPRLFVTLANDGATLGAVQGTLLGAGVAQGQATFGTAPALGKVAATAPFVVSIPANAGYNTVLGFTLRVTGENNFSTDLPLTITTAPGITDAPATITTRTWTADRVYMINGEVGIPAGQTLTIQPGTTVRFAENARLRVLGTLIAVGTPEQPITFTSQKAGKPWAGIVFEDSSVDALPDAEWGYAGGSIVRHAVLQNGGISSQMAGPYIADNLVISQDATPSAVMQARAAITLNATSPMAILRNQLEGGGDLMLSSTASGPSLVAENVLHGGHINVMSPDGPAMVRGNQVERTADAISTGIAGTGAVTIIGNLVRGVGIAIHASGQGPGRGGVVRGNLVTGATYAGIQALPAAYTYDTTPPLEISENTLVGNPGSAIRFESSGNISATIVVRDNNLIPSALAEGKGLWLPDNFRAAVNVEGNYWGTTDPAKIALLIRDGWDMFDVGHADFDPPLASPAQAAPAFVESVSVSPDTTLGIQSGTVRVRYSRAMDTAHIPALSFHDARRGTIANKPLPTSANGYTLLAADSRDVIWALNNGKVFRYAGGLVTQVPLPALGMMNTPQALAVGPDDALWISTEQTLLRYDDGRWTTYSRCTPDSNGCLYLNMGQRMTVGPDGVVWIAVTGVGTSETPITLLRFAGGAWTTHTLSNVTFTVMPSISDIKADADGSVWISLSMGPGSERQPNVLHFADGVWKNVAPLTPPPGTSDRTVSALAFDPEGTLWARLPGALAALEGGAWRFYQAPPTIGIAWGPLAIDRKGVKWLAKTGSLASFDGETWRNYTYPDTMASTSAGLVVDADGHKWLTHQELGFVVLYDGYETVLPPGAWEADGRTFTASVEVTSLVPRGPKRLVVDAARDALGRAAAPYAGNAFGVDYAGQVSDRTPPAEPYVFASGAGDPKAVTFHYVVRDDESAVERLRYAIGSAAGAGDVVSWTEVTVGAGAPTALEAEALAEVRQITRTGLGLTVGRAYYVSMQARNSSGLWSAVASNAFVAGQATNPRGYITALGPGWATAGTNGLSLTVSGYGFIPETKVLWNGAPRPTVYVSATEVRAKLSAADLATAGSARVAVRNPAPGGGDSATTGFLIGAPGSIHGVTKVYLPGIQR